MFKRCLTNSDFDFDIDIIYVSILSSNPSVHPFIHLSNYLFNYYRIGMSDGGLVTEAKPPVKWNKVTNQPTWCFPPRVPIKH